MPYHQKPALHDTLVSYDHYYAGRKDYEILVVEDGKSVIDLDTHNHVESMVEQFQQRGVPVRLIQTNFQYSYAPSKLFNLGVEKAKGEYIVLTNPECFHLTDVLGSFDLMLHEAPEAYPVATCFNAECNSLIENFTDFKYKHIGWYQHSKHMPRNLHWCSVLKKTLYNSLGGFDEGYATGFGREDVDWARRVEEAGIPILPMDNTIVVHISHPFIPFRTELVRINQAYYAKKWGAMDNR